MTGPEYTIKVWTERLAATQARYDKLHEIGRRARRSIRRHKHVGGGADVMAPDLNNERDRLRAAIVEMRRKLATAIATEKRYARLRRGFDVAADIREEALAWLGVL